MALLSVRGTWYRFLVLDYSIFGLFQFVASNGFLDYEKLNTLSAMNLSHNQHGFFYILTWPGLVEQVDRPMYIQYLII